MYLAIMGDNEDNRDYDAEYLDWVRSLDEDDEEQQRQMELD